MSTNSSAGSRQVRWRAGSASGAGRTPTLRLRPATASDREADLKEAEATKHGELRLLQRIGVDAPSLSELWADGRPVQPEDYECDRARFHQPTGTVLLMRDGHVVTVLVCTHARIEGPSEPNAEDLTGGSRAASE